MLSRFPKWMLEMESKKEYLKEKRKDTLGVPSTTEQDLVKPVAQDKGDQPDSLFLSAYPYTLRIRKDSTWKPMG